MTKTNTPAELVKTWKVETTAKGAILTVNGVSYELGASLSAILFDLQRAESGYTVPVRGAA